LRIVTFVKLILFFLGIKSDSRNEALLY